MLELPKNIPLQIWPSFPNVSILRGDLTHSVVSGNKYFKALPIIRFAKQQGIRSLITVGGRYSNHLHALSWAARESKLGLIGLVRGFEEQSSTSTLDDCAQWGAKLHFVNPSGYANRYEDSFWKPWLTAYPDAMRVDEGGWSPLSISGSSAWWKYIPADANIVVTAIGSGSTAVGLAASAMKGVQVVGVPAFKDPGGYLETKEKMKSHANGVQVDIWPDYVERGFGKMSPPQKEFKQAFELETGIPLDPVYTVKVLYSLKHYLTHNENLRFRKIVVLHTGGLQGNRS